MGISGIARLSDAPHVWIISSKGALLPAWGRAAAVVGDADLRSGEDIWRGQSSSISAA